MQEVTKIFEEMDEDDYEKIQESRRRDDFIVNDDGFGYLDKGGEIWEVDEDQEAEGGKKKKKKLNVIDLVNSLA